VTPDQRLVHGAIQTKQVLAQNYVTSANDSRRVQDLEGTVLQARVLRFERQSIMAVVVVWSAGVKPVQANSYPTTTIEQMRHSGFQKVCQGQQRGPQLGGFEADAGLVVYLLPTVKLRMRSSALLLWQANPPLVMLVPD